MPFQQKALYKKQLFWANLDATPGMLLPTPRYLPRLRLAEFAVERPFCWVDSNEISPCSVENTSSKGPFYIATLVFRSVVAFPILHKKCPRTPNLLVSKNRWQTIQSNFDIFIIIIIKQFYCPVASQHIVPNMRSKRKQKHITCTTISLLPSPTFHFPPLSQHHLRVHPNASGLG